MDFKQEFMDASKLKDWLRCEAYYFFRHVVGWTHDTPSKDLVFGEAWHRALGTLYSMYKAEGNWKTSFIDAAYQAGESYYRKYFSQEDDVANSPKSPGFLLRGLIAYFEKYSYLDKFEVLDTEVITRALISPTRYISGRLDLLFRTPSGISILEHKTSSYSSSYWSDQWLLSIQPRTYQHLLNMLFGDNSENVTINGYIVRKNDQDFIRVPLHYTPDMLAEYLTIVNRLINVIEIKCAILEDSDFRFTKNSESCFKWNRKCEFLPFCQAWQNPLKYTHKVPAGMTIKFWEGVQDGDN